MFFSAARGFSAVGRGGEIGGVGALFFFGGEIFHRILACITTVADRKFPPVS